MSTTTKLDTLKINYLTQAQYDAEVSGGTIDEDALYLTPDSVEVTKVIAQGTGNGWTYRKWSDGTMEMWCTVTITAQTNSSDAGGYVSASAATPQNFPFTFASVPNVQVTCDSGGVTGSVTSSVRPSTTSAGSWKLYRNTSNTNTADKNFMFYVVGSWQ